MAYKKENYFSLFIVYIFEIFSFFTVDTPFLEMYFNIL